MGSAPLSTDYGRRLLPVEIDRLAQDEPDRVLFHVPRDNHPANGFDKVTTSRFANAVNRACWWLQSQIGTSRQTIGYVGLNDIRYLILIVAATKTGNRILLSSPRNSIEGHSALIQQSNCRFWINTEHINKPDAIDLPLIKAPSLKELLEPTPVPPYRYEKTWQDGSKDTFVLLHTSGSTGLPRLIPITLAAISTGDALAGVGRIQGKLPTLAQWANTKMLNVMPLFHVAGLCFSLCCPVFFGYSIVCPPSLPVARNVLEETIDNIDIDSAFVSPLALIDIVKAPTLLKKLTKLKFITSAGGPVPPAVGKIIHSHVPLIQTMGMTEALLVPSVATHPEEWAYYHFHPCCGFEMRPYSDTLFELVFVRRKELAATQTIFLTFPELDLYETKDLYSRHPTIPDLYKYEARKDDLVVLSNGEKFNPTGVEFHLAHHPWLAAIYITGKGRFQTCALLSPAPDRMEASDAEIIAAVWPMIETTNSSLPAFAHVHRDFVRVTREPFPRTPKGTMARHDIERTFTKQIDDIYGDADTTKSLATTSATGSLQIDGSSEETVRAGLQQALQLVSDKAQLAQMTDDGNIFETGFDSLQTIRLARLLNGTSTFSGQVDADTIYSHPSVADLSHVLWTRLRDSRQLDQRALMADASRTKDIARVLGKHLPSFALPRERKEHVVLTGTTGALGPYVLDALCKNSSIATVWCLNRSSAMEAACRQAELARANGLTPNWSGKVRFLQMDLASDGLGLSPADAREIRESATIIFHNAWEVNFNLPLGSFETQLKGVQNLVDICRSSRHKMRFFFVSSISVATKWPIDVLGPVPETKLSNLDGPATGYGASKLVAEHLLSTAAQAGVISHSILRVGQVAGPVVSRGSGSEWKRRDWVPAIIDASAYLGKLPADLGGASHIDWIPVDLLSEIIGQLVDSSDKASLTSQRNETYYNLVNPQAVSWSSLVPTIKGRLEGMSTSQKKIQVVPFAQWLQDLEKAEDKIAQAAEGQNGTANGSSVDAKQARAAFKLLSFFSALAQATPSDGDGSGVEAHTAAPVWARDNAMAHSTVFGVLAPVSPAWFEMWLDQWGY